MRGGVLLAFLVGLGVGAFGGLLGLGGAELRLPLLLYPFGLAPLEAVIANKALSLLVVGVSLPARLGHVPWGEVLEGGRQALALLMGSVLGAFGAAGWARRVPPALLQRTMGLLLLLLAGVLVLETLARAQDPLRLSPLLLQGVGFLLGLGIGGVAAVMGVAGGELLIPTLVLVFGLEPRLAGSVSLLISLPTMLAAFAQYSQDRTFAVLWRRGGLLLAMGLGSLLGGALGGGLLLGLVTERVLLLLLALLLAFSGLRLLGH